MENLKLYCSLKNKCALVNLFIKMCSRNSWKYFYLEQNLFLYKVKLTLIRILSKPLSNDDEGKDDYPATIIDNCTYQKVFLKKIIL